ncbi:MAG TPA: dihydropyrimidine dehydrogenase, partial [bacterium]|nr:dihydropyrimidine dehydrogenase [bacterium]
MALKLRLHKTPVQTLQPGQRIRNFLEVSLGYTEDQALTEAARCLQCKHAPCMLGCPVEINIPAFIAQVKAQDYAGAIDTIKDKNNLPAICGRVCPQESQCENRCVLAKTGEPVGIGRLERFVADFDLAAQHCHSPEVAAASGFKA